MPWVCAIALGPKEDISFPGGVERTRIPSPLEGWHVPITDQPSLQSHILHQ